VTDPRDRQKGNQPGPEDLLDSVVVLWRLWTMPKSSVEAIEFELDQKKNAAVLGLVAIGFLVFALRGLPDLQTWLLAGGFGGSLAFILNWFSSRLKTLLAQNVLISGFATVAITMAITVVVQSFLSNYFLNFSYELAETFGSYSLIALPVVLAMIPTFIVWVIKARLFDHARIGKDSLLYSGIVTIAGSCVVVVASFVNVEIFQRIVDLVRH
jgi:hypothetical protein